jgi:hypothetical protein
LQYATDSLDKDLANQKPNDTVKSGAIDLVFSPNGKCSGTFERTGTKAFVFQDGTAGPNLVPLSAVDDYCWSADLTPSFVLKAGKRLPSAPCNDDSGHQPFAPISNNYTAFVLNALPTSETLGPEAPGRKEALDRCKANGLREGACMRVLGPRH